MDLDISLARTVGRAKAPVHGEVVRPLTAEDIALLGAERGTRPAPLQKIRDSHHSAARALAEGLSLIEVQILTGYTPSRLSILRSDPAFAELIEFYREKKDAVYADFHSLASSVSAEALEELRDRIRDNPEERSDAFLLRAIEALADRTGHGPTAKTVNLHATVNYADRVASGRARVGLGSAPSQEQGPAAASGAARDPLLLEGGPKGADGATREDE